MAGVVLPHLVWRESPNQSDRRLPKGQKPHLVVVHRPVGGYQGSVEWLCNPAAQASAHVITEGSHAATQLVPWDRKAWHAVAFNSISYGIEVDDDAWNGHDADAFAVAARVVAFVCQKTGIPAKWSHDPLNVPGIVRHYDLGVAGGGHTDPTTDRQLWDRFVHTVQRELARGGFRKTWGRGRWGLPSCR